MFRRAIQIDKWRPRYGALESRPILSIVLQHVLPQVARHKMFLTSLDCGGVGEKTMEKIRWLTDRFLAGIARHIRECPVDVKDASLARIPLIAGNNDGFRGNFPKRLQQVSKNGHAQPDRTGRILGDNECPASLPCAIFSPLPICRGAGKFAVLYTPAISTPPRGKSR